MALDSSVHNQFVPWRHIKYYEHSLIATTEECTQKKRLISRTVDTVIEDHVLLTVF
jgi:hypothetical protein